MDPLLRARQHLLVRIALLVLIAASGSAVLSATRGRATQPARQAQQRRTQTAPASPAALECGDLVGFQVLLDRAGFSPGEIDGKPGPNFQHALAAFQQAHSVESNGQPDCNTWHALGGDTGSPILVPYSVSDSDVHGNFRDIPKDMMQQAHLPLLGYQSPLEKVAERFHVSPALLQTLNPDVEIAPGEQLQVPAVEPFNADTKPMTDPSAADITIQVSRGDSALRALRPDGTTVFFAPVTTGSQHDPLPTGTWKVEAVHWWPVFHYNPELFWDAKTTHTKATIKPGPNNPVGVVWIGLNLEHYGLHGTPEPGRIGHTESHGCVRLTNWDAARVASLVQPGTPVIFR